MILRYFCFFLVLPLVLFGVGPIKPRIGVDLSGDRLIVWQEDFVDGTSEIRFARISLGDLDWSTPIAISNPSRVAYLHDVVMNFNGDLLVGWHEDDPINNVPVMVVRTRSAGGTWAAPVTVSSPNELVFQTFDLSLNNNGIASVIWTSYLLDLQQTVVNSSKGSIGGAWGPKIQVSP